MLQDYRVEPFTAEGHTFELLRRGDGPGVVLLPEVPGVTPSTVALADRIVDAGFHVAIVSLLGTPGRAWSVPYVLQGMLGACVRREFAVLASDRSSPIVGYVRAVARHVHAEQGGPGVAALGMCLTGNFALGVLLEPCGRAAVMSQPSLPFPLGATRKAAVHFAPDELATIREQTDRGARALGLRFTHDPLCPAQRFARLRRELGPAFEAIEIDSGPGNAHGIARAHHSVLTEHLVDRDGHPTRAALARVLAFLREQLVPA